MKLFLPHRLLVGVAITLCNSKAFAGQSISLDLGETPQVQMNTALKMILLLTTLSVAPAILLATTSFIRIAVVFSFLRTALGVQNMPPQQVLLGLALFMSAAIMAPVATELYQKGIAPYMDGRADAQQAFAQGSQPLRNFMLKQTRENDLLLFHEISHAEKPASPAHVQMHLLIPAFIVSELRTSFEMGFVLFAPFLLVDLVIASILMAMGMVMLPPALVSLPIKIMLFVLADGWNLLVGSLVRSFS